MDINSLKIKVINSVTHSRGLERVQCRSQTNIHRNKCPLFMEWVNLFKQNWGLGRMVGFTLWLRDLQKLANPYTYQSKIIWVWCQMTREGVCGQVGLSLQKWVRQYCSGSYCHCVQNISTPFLLPAILPACSYYIVTNLFCRVPAGHFCLATANLPVRSQSLKQKKEWYDLSFDGWKKRNTKHSTIKPCLCLTQLHCCQTHLSTTAKEHFLIEKKSRVCKRSTCLLKPLRCLYKSRSNFPC